VELTKLVPEPRSDRDVTVHSSHANQEPEDNSFENDPLAAIASHLEVLDVLKEKASALEAQSSRSNRERGRHRNWTNDSEDDSESSRRGRRPPHAKIESPKFSGGDPRGWVVKPEKYFRYYDIPEYDKVDIASRRRYSGFVFLDECKTYVVLLGDLVKALQEHYGLPEYQNPNEHLYNIKQTSSVQEYRLAFARQTT